MEETTDAGDGVPAWKKFVMDVDPNQTGNGLRVESVTMTDTDVEVVLRQASVKRVYSLQTRADLTSGDWVDLPDQAGIQGTGGQLTLTDTGSVEPGYYRVQVSIAP